MANELTVSQNSGAELEQAPATSDLAAGDQGGFASLPADASRKAVIQAIMRTDIDRYYAEGLDREYAALLQAETEGGNPDAGNPTAPMPADDARVSLCSSQAGQKLVYEWERMGGFKAHLSNVQKDVGAIVRETGNNRAQRVFMEEFSRSVPQSVEIAIMDEVASGRPYVQPAGQAEIDIFANRPAGKILVQSWGSEAPEKVAILRTRALRIVQSISEDDAACLWAWLDDQDTAVVVKIFRQLAGG
ncbi:hypothetical protein FJ434_16475 [Mesorhizobium sp. B2-5-13]|uniref:hypothetical protein n=1 Tax=unclassified Mesorhizobium TaxID=325217 RepID=UPI001127D9FE|nr:MULTISPECIES: hypothetical protein [unclassified Mesorhizobium]TPJ85520.1 hypothetical protein FJ434_16475 [Mesorhizobium sp. B2-5-13]TPK39268.1 hypothetical protein FJ560_29385 [Mesorhizobium sp. B2-5-5]